MHSLSKGIIAIIVCAAIGLGCSAPEPTKVEKAPAPVAAVAAPVVAPAVIPASTAAGVAVPTARFTLAYRKSLLKRLQEAAAEIEDLWWI